MGCWDPGILDIAREEAVKMKVCKQNETTAVNLGDKDKKC